MSAAWIIVIVVLWLVVVGLVVVVAGVLRRVAAALESQVGIGAPAQLREGPPKGAPLPGIAVGEVGGRTLALSDVPGPFVLAVLTSHCAPCLSIAEWLRAHPQRLQGARRLVVLTDAHGRSVIGLDDYATVLTDDDDDAAFGALDVPGTPFVVDINAEGRVISSSLLSGPDQLLGMLDTRGSGPSDELPIRVVG